MQRLPVKIIYNPDSKESLNDRKVFGGNPDGMINFTRMKYLWALNLWDTMEANTWFPKEVQMTGDAKDYKLLSEPEKRMYDLVLSQLIFMDSLQTNNLMDNINPYITAPEINACLSRQSYEEANHSKSYAVMVESISENTDEIYNMWKTDAKLLEKNKYIASVYQELSQGEITDEKIVLALFANQILGFTDAIITQYIQYLADRRLEAVGYKPEYNVKHPIPWVDGYASFNDQRTNFFEGNVVNYSKGSISFDDDF